MILRNTELDPFVRKVLEPLTEIDVELLFQIFLYLKHHDWLTICVKHEADIDLYLHTAAADRTTLLCQWKRRRAVVVAYAAAIRVQHCHDLSHAFHDPGLWAERDSQLRRLARAELYAAFLSRIQEPELYWPFEHLSPWEWRKRKDS